MTAAVGSKGHDPAEAGVNPLAKVKVRPQDKAYWAGDTADQKDPKHLTVQALNKTPSKKALHQFEQEEFADRQMTLAEVRFLEKEVNLKGLPAALVLVPVAVAIIGLSLRPNEAIIEGWIAVVAVSVYAAVAAGAILYAIKDHARKEACLNSWTKALEDSHARASKKEEEQVKSDFADFKAAATVKTTSKAPDEHDSVLAGS